jgi:endoglucanase
MRTNRSVLASALTLAVALGPPAWAHGEGFLHTHGHDMVDEKGNKILLRGVGLGNYLLPEGYMWRFGPAGDRPRKIERIVSDLIGPENADRFWVEFRKNYITEADIRRIAELGFNSVRPALNARRFLTEGDSPVYVDEGFELLDSLVTWCRKWQVYVIIDMHGAPGGQTGQNIDDSPNDEPGLFMDPVRQKWLIDLWVKIAERYKNEPAVAGYDLLNEPLPERTGAAGKYKKDLEPLYQRIAAAIRTVDSKHMIILEGADWSNDWSVFSKPFDANLVYQFHYYCWDNPDNLNDISRFVTRREKLNAPVWVGETGERDNAIYWATTQYFEHHNIGWAFWPWKKMEADNSPYSIRAPGGWDAVAGYTRGGPKPSPEVAQRAFDELLRNIRLENCTYNGDVVHALFHRLPVRIEAENYGHEEPGKSFSLKDAAQKSKFYRKSEPVPVESRPEGAEGRRRRSIQSIRLSADEWTAYDLTSREDHTWQVEIRALATSGPAVVALSFNDQERKIAVKEGPWSLLSVGSVKATKGANHLKLRALTGTVEFDWIEIRDGQRVPEPTERP